MRRLREQQIADRKDFSDWHKLAIHYIERLSNQQRRMIYSVVGVLALMLGGIFGSMLAAADFSGVWQQIGILTPP